MDSRKYYKIKELDKDFYALHHANVCIYLIVGKESALVFDTGFGFADPLPAIRSITELPLKVVASHGHFDHVGGDSYFKEPIHIHEKDIPLAELHLSPKCRAVGYDAVMKFQKILFWMKAIPKDLDRNEFIHTKINTNYVTIKEGDSFELGGATLTVIELPGHTQGSIGLYWKERKCLLTGDAINRGTYIYLPESSKLEGYINTIKKAQSLDIDSFVGAHEAKIYPKSELEKYLAVAMNPDYENGKPHIDNDLAPGVDARECFEKGKKKGPFIVVGNDKF